MAFKHLSSRQVTDAQWDHVESLGVKTVFGNAFNRRIWDLTVDEERGFYLVSRGMYGRNMTGADSDVYFYALCLDDNVFYFELTLDSTGDAWSNSYERHYHVNGVGFPDGWDFSKLSVDRFKQIATEAFTAETHKIYSPEMLKEVTVDFPENFVDKICDREKRNKDDKK